MGLYRGAAAVEAGRRVNEGIPAISDSQEMRGCEMETSCALRTRGCVELEDGLSQDWPAKVGSAA